MWGFATHNNEMWGLTTQCKTQVNASKRTVNAGKRTVERN